MKKIRKITKIIILLLILASCKSTGNIQTDSIANHRKYFETSVSPVKGLMITAHGLNTKPSKMGDDNTDGTLVKLFLDEGYHVYLAVLPGHEGTIKENINKYDWLISAHSQYREAAEIAQKNNLRIFLTAFSLGALVYHNLMINEDDVKFSAAALFAPAAAIKGITRAGIFAADIFLTDNAIINSRAPIEYQAQKGVSISAYKALFELEDNLYKNKFVDCNIPTLIFIDPNDELIGINKLRKTIKKFNLSNWSIITVSNSGTKITPNYHHLIIDNKCVSSETWNIICENIINFLDEI